MGRGRKVACLCEGCGQPFEVRVADRKRGWGRYCSKRCKAIEQERRTGQYGRMLRDDDIVRAGVDQVRAELALADGLDAMSWDSHKGALP